MTNPLSRTAVDRAAYRRADPAALDAAFTAPGTRVVLVAEGEVAVRGDGLDLVAPQAVTANLWLFLGEDDDGAYVAAEVSRTPDRTWASLREVGHRLSDRDVDIATSAVALAAWHARNRRCPSCGGTTEPAQGGWTRRCETEGTEEYPRTDPAVIMAVVDSGDRILLGHAAHWPPRRFSTLAGFVEPGESAEAAVHREVGEETGLAVVGLEYVGSQPWPFPASLMLAYRARVGDGEPHPDGVELTAARWFTRQDLDEAVRTGEVLLPPPSSVARSLIQDWYGGEL